MRRLYDIPAVSILTLGDLIDTMRAGEGLLPTASLERHGSATAFATAPRLCDPRRGASYPPLQTGGCWSEDRHRYMAPHEEPAFAACPWRAVMALVCAVALGAFSKGGTKAYKWMDKDGVVHYGDTIPPEYSEQAHQELNSQGVAVRDFRAS